MNRGLGWGGSRRWWRMCGGGRGRSPLRRCGRATIHLLIHGFSPKPGPGGDLGGGQSVGVRGEQGRRRWWWWRYVLEGNVESLEGWGLSWENVSGAKTITTGLTDRGKAAEPSKLRTASAASAALTKRAKAVAPWWREANLSLWRVVDVTDRGLPTWVFGVLGEGSKGVQQVEDDSHRFIRQRRQVGQADRGALDFVPGEGGRGGVS